MKQLWKRGISLALAGTLCLSMAACGKKSGDSSDGGKSTTNSTSALATELGYGYLSEYHELNVDADYINSNNVSTAGGKLYFASEKYSDDGNYQPLLYCVDPATGETTQIPTPSYDNSGNTSTYVQNVMVTPDASAYWLLTNTYTMDMSYDDSIDGTVSGDAYGTSEETGEVEETRIDAEAAEDTVSGDAYGTGEAQSEAAEAPIDDTVSGDAYGTGETAAAEDSTVYDDAYGDTASSGEPGITYTAAKYDMSGNLISQFAITPDSGSDSFYPMYAVQDKNGDLLFGDDTTVYQYGDDGTLKGTVDLDASWVMNILASGDGTVVISYYPNNDAGSAVLATIENGAVSEPLNITGVTETNTLSYFPGNGSTLMASDGTYLYSIDLTTGTATKLLSWLDSDINSSNMNGIAAPTEDTILVLTTTYHQKSGANTYELGTLTKTPADQLPQRTILTLGAEYLDDTIRNAVIAYNRKSNDYRITLVDYSQYNTEDDYTKSTEQLDRDVISGNCPDIISLSTGHEARYIAKGVLADMSALMDKDDSVSMDQLVSSALQAYTVGGKLYGMPTSFSLQTVLASLKLVGDRTSWTISELGEIIDGLDEGTQVMTYTSQDSFLNMMTYQNLSQFVDFGAATCSFDSDEFKQLLAVSAKLPTQDEIDQALNSDTYGVSNQDEYSMLQSGDLLMTTSYLSGYSYSMKEFYNVCNKDHGIVPIGYPLSSGNGVKLSVSGGLAISAKSKNIDAAWDFVKTMLDDSIQQDLWDFPVTRSALDTLLQDAAQPETYVDENGETQVVESSTYIGDTEYTMEPLTQEQVEDFKSLIDGAFCSGSYDADIMNIISEESAAYFSGDKTADDVAKLIQNRVSIYLGEIS